MNFWQNLAPRERLLIGIAAGLLAILALWFLAVRPVMTAHENAKTAQELALADLEIVQKGAVKLGGTSIGNRQPFDRNAVIRTAQTQSLNLSRVQPENDGALKVWFEDAGSAQLYKFLSDITSGYAAEITNAQISRKNNGTVNAAITLKPIGA